MAGNSNLPDTYNIQWRGIKPQVHSSHPWVPVGDAYITVGYDPVKNIIMSNLQMKDTGEYKGKISIKINGKVYDITNKVIKINCNSDLKAVISFTYWRPGYSNTVRVATFDVKSNGRPFSIENTSIQEYWGYVLEGFGYKPWLKIPDEYKEYYDISKSKQISIEEPYDVDLPANLSYDQRKAIKEVFGYDMVKLRNPGTQEYWIGLWPKNQYSVDKKQPENSTKEPISKTTITGETQIPDLLKMKITLVKKPILRGVLVEVSGNNVSYTKLLSKHGESIELNVNSGCQYTIYAKEEFGLFKKSTKIEAKVGNKSSIKGFGYELDIEII